MFALGMASGGALSTLGPSLALTIDAATFALSALFFFGLAKLEPPRTKHRPRLLYGVRDALAFTWPRPRLRRAVFAKDALGPRRWRGMARPRCSGRPKACASRTCCGRCSAAAATSVSTLRMVTASLSTRRSWPASSSACRCVRWDPCPASHDRLRRCPRPASACSCTPPSPWTAETADPSRDGFTAPGFTTEANSP